MPDLHTPYNGQNPVVAEVPDERRPSFDSLQRGNLEVMAGDPPEISADTRLRCYLS